MPIINNTKNLGDFEYQKFEAGSDNKPVVRTRGVGGKLVTEGFDYISRTLTNSTTETYVYRLGGSGGATVATVTVVYTDSTLETISSVTRT